MCKEPDYFVGRTENNPVRRESGSWLEANDQGGVRGLVGHVRSSLQERPMWEPEAVPVSPSPFLRCRHYSVTLSRRKRFRRDGHRKAH